MYTALFLLLEKHYVGIYERICIDRRDSGVMIYLEHLTNQHSSQSIALLREEASASLFSLHTDEMLSSPLP